MTSVVVVGTDSGPGLRVTRGLAGRGIASELVGPAGDRQAIAAACGAAAGSLAAVVHADVVAESLRPRPLAEVDDHQWRAWVDGPVRATLATLQVASAHLRDGGTIVVVVPAVALVGQPGLVPLCTAGEAQRLLAKSAARRWGEAGLRVNVVAADLAALGADPGVAGGVATRGPALRPDPGGDDLVDAVALLLRPDATRLTGTTLVADGGDLMAP